MNRVRVIGTLVVTGLIVGLAVWLGLQIEFVIAVGILSLAVGTILATPLGSDTRASAPAAESQDRYRGSEVSRLAWAVKLRDDSVGEMVTRRVRATLRRRLALRGLDPDRPADAAEVDRLLGQGLWDRLNGRRARPTDIDEALTRADALIGATEHPTANRHPPR